ncbi:MAG: hypothetical protein R3E63_07565 [Pseudomonadales bacterium]
MAMLLLVIIALEVIAAFVLNRNPSIETTRQYLRGEQQMQLDMNSVPQAYLLYIPAPNYVTPVDNIKQNNADGYRGEAIPLQRSLDSLRILFMGGSTTYGEGVAHPEEAFLLKWGNYCKKMRVFLVNGLRLLMPVCALVRLQKYSRIIC